VSKNAITRAAATIGSEISSKKGRFVHESGRDYAAWIDRPGQTSAEYLSLPDLANATAALDHACEHLGISRETSNDSTGLPWELIILA
jgi:hypothetical protein